MTQDNNGAGERLQTLRGQIDALDQQLLQLIEQRANLARQVGEDKRARGVTQFSVSEREAQILRRMQAASALPAAHVSAIFREIISTCLAQEKPAAAAYFGPAGTYTHEAALKLFGHAATYLPMPSIEAAIGEAEKERCDYAVVPFENSAAGTVGATLDAMVQTPLQINGETVLRIRHNLLCADADSSPAALKEIWAHPQALEQCRGWLASNAPQAKYLAADSNAQAVKLAAAERGRGIGAIGSRAAQDIYHMTLLASDIEDFSNNSTRFLVLGRRAPAASGADKTSFVMTVRDEAGEMFEALKPMKDCGVNMVKLESRPLRGRLWEYLFFVDCIGHQQDEAVARALRGVGQRAAFMKILGSYPQAVE